MSERLRVEPWQRPWLDWFRSTDRLELRQTRRGPRWVRIPATPDPATPTRAGLPADRQESDRG